MKRREPASPFDRLVAEYDQLAAEGQLIPQTPEARVTLLGFLYASSLKVALAELPGGGNIEELGAEQWARIEPIERQLAVAVTNAGGQVGHFSISHDGHLLIDVRPAWQRWLGIGGRPARSRGRYL